MPRRNLEARRAYDRGRDRRAYMARWTPRGTGRRLSDTTRRLIREAVLECGASVADMARAFGVSYGHAWKIAHGWRRPPRAP